MYTPMRVLFNVKQLKTTILNGNFSGVVIFSCFMTLAHVIYIVIHPVKEKFSSLRNKMMLRRTKKLIADQLPEKGKVHVYMFLI